MQKDQDNIQVIIRVRPLNTRELSDNKCEKCVLIDPRNPKRLVLSQKPFEFDWVCGEEATQHQIFESIGKSMVDRCLEGYNCCIFAYGQTGTGKTYTMQGRDLNNDPDDPNRGLQPRIIDRIFSLMKKDMEEDSTTFKISCSYFEIYNENIMDLLEPCNKKFHVREGYVEGLKDECVKDCLSTIKLMNQGAKNRHVGSTKMNDQSSRSHSIFTLAIERKTLVDGIMTVRKSKFHFVDLAGSERQNQTQSTGDRLKEASNINKSLTVLGQVINSLVKVSEGSNKESYIRYRDSKLTFILKDSLGGNSKTCLIANISPASTSSQETNSTLLFASGAKQIKNKASINEELGESGAIPDLEKELRLLREEKMKLIEKQMDVQKLTTDQNEKIGKLESEIQELIKREMDNKNESESKEKNYIELLSKFEALSEANKRTEQNYEEKIRDMQKFHREHKQKYEKALAEAERKNIESQNQNKELVLRCQELEGFSDFGNQQKEEELQKELTELKCNIEALRTANKKNDFQIFNLRDNISKAEGKIKSLEERNRILNECERANKDLINRHQYLETFYKISLAEKEKENAEKIESLDIRFKNELGRLNREIGILEEEIAALTENNNKLQEENSILVQSVQVEEPISMEEPIDIQEIQELSSISFDECYKKMDTLIRTVLEVEEDSFEEDEIIEEEQEYDPQEGMNRLSEIEYNFGENTTKEKPRNIPRSRIQREVNHDNQNRGLRVRRDFENDPERAEERRLKRENSMINKLKSEIGTHEQNKFSMKEAIMGIFGEAKKMCKAYQHQIDELKKKLKQVKQQDGLKESLKIKARWLEKQLESKSKELEESKKVSHEVEELTAKNAELEEEIQKSEKRLNKFKKSLNQKEEEFEELRQKYDKQESRKKNLKIDLKEAEEKYSTDFRTLNKDKYRLTEERRAHAKNRDIKENLKKKVSWQTLKKKNPLPGMKCELKIPNKNREHNKENFEAVSSKRSEIRLTESQYLRKASNEKINTSYDTLARSSEKYENFLDIGLIKKRKLN